MSNSSDTVTSSKYVQQLFDTDNKSIIVALDHTGSGMYKGWDVPKNTILSILKEPPDAVLTNFGILKQYSSLFMEKTMTILRLDGGPTDISEKWPDLSSWEDLYSVEDAIGLGAKGVMVTLFIGSKLEAGSMRIVAKVAAECYKQNIMCGVQAIPVPSRKISNVYDPEIVSFVSRLAAELGADFVNTYFTGSQKTFRKVTERCPVPVLFSGGEKMELEEQFLKRVTDALKAGGGGVVVGRNVWQREDPTMMLRLLKKAIHSGYREGSASS